MQRIKFILLIVILIKIGFVAQGQVSRDDAYGVIKKSGHVDTLKYNVSVSKQIIPPNTTLTFMDESIISPNYESWFFLIDQNPFASWTHPCKYIFVSLIDTSTVVINGQNGASFPTDILLKQEVPEHLKLPAPIFNDSSTLKSTQLFLENNYAIIISGGMDKYNNNLRYWNNCSYVYKTLIQKGYKTDNIFVLSSDGTSSNDDLHYFSGASKKYKSQNLDLDGNGINDIGYSATKSDIAIVIDKVEDKIAIDQANEDFSNVFIYVTDHGGQVGTTKDVYLYLWGEQMNCSEFYNEVSKLSYATFVEIIMDQCHSGGFADAFNQHNAIITTSCAYNEVATSVPDGTGIFLALWLSAIKGTDISTNINISSLVDTNLDGFLSFSEAADYAKKNVVRYNMTSKYISSPSSLGSYLTIDNINPKSSCYDGVQNNGEGGIDCGGICDKSCPIVTYPRETCNDNVQNQDETGVDCGGSKCPPCGVGGNLNGAVTASDCLCSPAEILYSNDATMVSGLNLLDIENINITHGWLYYNIENSSSYPKENYICNGKAYSYSNNCELSGGIYFEEEGFRFSPDKMYEITFNRWMDTDNVMQFKLANGLTQNLKELTYSRDFGSQHYDGYFYTSSETETPSISESFNIGFVDDSYFYTENTTSCNQIPYSTGNARYKELSITFQPDEFYSQLWIYADQQKFNSVKIRELCMENFIYTDNSSTIYNPTRALNTILLEDLTLTPTNSVEFVAGNSVVLKNVRLSPQQEGSVNISIDNCVCLDNQLKSSEILAQELQDYSARTELSTLSYYPNPAKSQINYEGINVDSKYGTNLLIFNIQGELLDEKKLFNSSGVIDISYLPSGILILKANNQVRKIVKK